LLALFRSIEVALDPRHPDAAVLLDNLAMVLSDLGRPGEAAALHRRALAIREAALGPDHPDLALWLSNLAAALRNLGRPAEAEPLEVRALAIRTAVRERMPGPTAGAEAGEASAAAGGLSPLPAARPATIPTGTPP
jgi:hypothetical protein